jgi:hypothetical protein
MPRRWRPLLLTLMLALLASALVAVSAQPASASITGAGCSTGETEASTSAEIQEKKEEEPFVSGESLSSEDAGKCGEPKTLTPKPGHVSFGCGESTCIADASTTITSGANATVGSVGATFDAFSEAEADASASTSGSKGGAFSLTGESRSNGGSATSFTITEPLAFTISGSVALSSHEGFQTGIVSLSGGPEGDTIFILESGSGGMTGTLAPGTYALRSDATVQANAVWTSVERSASSHSGANASATLTLGGGECPSGQVGSVKVGFALAEGCFAERSSGGHGTGVFETEQRAWVGGLEVDPVAGGKLVLDTKAEKLSTEGAGAPIMMDGLEAPFAVAALPVNLNEGTIEVSQGGNLEKLLLGLPVKGKVKAVWTEAGRGSTLEGEISIANLLPASLKLESPEVEGKFRLDGADRTGFSVTQAEAKISELSLNPKFLKLPNKLGLRNMNFKFERRAEGKPFWRAGTQILLPIKDSQLAVGGEVVIFDGSLAGGGVSGDGLEVEIPDTPFFLQSVEGELVLQPEFGFKSGAGLSFGPRVASGQLATIEGTLSGGVVVPPTECPNGLDPFKVEGKLKFAPLETVAKAENVIRVCGYAGEITADEAKVKGVVEWGDKAKGVLIGEEGSFTGFIGATGFDLEGEAKIAIPLLPQLTGRVIMSDQGIAACTNINAFFEGGWGYRFGDALPTVFSACDLGPFRTTALPASARAASARARTLSVRHGLRIVAFSASAAGGAPRVKVTGPHGETFASPASGAVRNNAVVIVPSGLEHTTYVVITRPAAGRWHVEPLDPGVSLTRVGVADGLPRVHVSGRLSRRHGRELLSYRVRRIPGQKVTFVERGPGGVDRTLGVAHGSGGTIRFSPTMALKRARTIVAEVVENGLPRKVVTVARFSAAAPPRLATPKVTSTRKGSTLVLSWRKVAGAKSYFVTVSAESAVIESKTTSATRLTVSNVPATGPLTITVQPLTGFSAGPVATAHA